MYASVLDSFESFFQRTESVPKETSTIILNEIAEALSFSVGSTTHFNPFVPIGKFVMLKFWLERFFCPDNGIDSEVIWEINTSFSFDLIPFNRIILSIKPGQENLRR